MPLSLLACYLFLSSSSSSSSLFNGVVSLFLFYILLLPPSLLLSSFSFLLWISAYPEFSLCGHIVVFWRGEGGGEKREREGDARASSVLSPANSAAVKLS